MSAARFDDGWGYFEKVYCISLEERTDRREEAKDQFRSVGLLDRVEFTLVRKHLIDREQGIYESHMACIRKGLQTDARNILVFEDDILFERFGGSGLRHCTDFLSAVPDWNLLFLGCLVRSSKRTSNPSVLQVRSEGGSDRCGLAIGKESTACLWERVIASFPDRLLVKRAARISPFSSCATSIEAETQAAPGSM